MTDKTLVSVIIPTKNSEDTIEKCLESIKNQTYPDVEIILVDNYSRNHTKEIARKYGARIYLKGPERASPVNFGVKEAKGKYVYRDDSDFVLEPSVVEEAVTKCEVEGYDAVAVHNTSDPTVVFGQRLENFKETAIETMSLILGEIPYERSV